MDSQPTPKRRAYWLKTLHQWHWISSALCLLGMLLFAITGLTLNNASHIESKAVVTTRQAQLPEPVRKQLTAPPKQKKAALPPPVAQWLDDTFDAGAAGKTAEWSADEIYLSLPRAGGDAWLSIDLASGDVEYERTDRGWISYLNDLHKGRNTGLAWSWFLDIFAVACLVFSLTGLVLLKMHAGNRGATWPMVGLGVVIPVVLALLFIH
ncbi:MULTISPECIES: PepSY-associated TM helix domain-containing protein [Achromobacter]|uniref:PepSY-associated TM helix domain-containing protein n=1 Tax=Achromobacter spanius TaxID=217203 RepID=A0ABY8GZV8_9BURK|nr:MULTISPECIES: PepSY-associated TM helix domain-containing protein [Achromobacter]WAI86172.1 PepSY-associated TM helix domain-containing protein [Achromobacter spanius]WEX96252.1 PepSY-associated TM helix domain-containing protein [Achromobacter sp. SS2-2022]WFP10029.1 PepSY-associated TM helix domain-containing protein [Achromobacter spanius]